MTHSGEFDRDINYIPDRITKDARKPDHGPVEGELWPVEAGRYRLVAARACPWANRSIIDRKSTRLNSSHIQKSRMPSSA